MRDAADLARGNAPRQLRLVYPVQREDQGQRATVEGFQDGESMGLPRREGAGATHTGGMRIGRADWFDRRDKTRRLEPLFCSLIGGSGA